MTDKKAKILNIALELFANDGYNAVSTSKIAKKAGVSEGLIFRHFENKKGLLDAIMSETEERLHKIFAQIIMEDDPKEVLHKTILLPFQMDESNYDFWRLNFKLKWEKEYFKPEKVKPLIDKLTWALTELKFEQAELEARLLEKTIESISIGILREGKASQMAYKDLLLKKYLV